MAKNAYMWIRDGVLINRMHVNPVCFAAAYWLNLAQEDSESVAIETLINFGFEKSGYSCLEKMQMFNDEHKPVLKDLEGAAAFYIELAGAIGESCNYFDFAPELLKKLGDDGCNNYITSAIDQPVLDQWIESNQGFVIEDSITEMLGKRDRFSKGYDHFKYVSEQIGGGKIFYIADAVSEISTGAKYASEFNITTIGFAYHIDSGAVSQAYDMVRSLNKELPELNLERIKLPTPVEIVESLRGAGANLVVMGSAQNIMANLAVKLQLLNATTNGA